MVCVHYNIQSWQQFNIKMVLIHLVLSSNPASKDVFRCKVCLFCPNSVCYFKFIIWKPFFFSLYLTQEGSQKQDYNCCKKITACISLSFLCNRTVEIWTQDLRMWILPLYQWRHKRVQNIKLRGCDRQNDLYHDQINC